MLKSNHSLIESMLSPPPRKMLTKDLLIRPYKEMTEEVNVKKMLMTTNSEDKTEMPINKLSLT